MGAAKTGIDLGFTIDKTPRIDGCVIAAPLPAGATIMGLGLALLGITLGALAVLPEVFSVKSFHQITSVPGPGFCRAFSWRISLSVASMSAEVSCHWLVWIRAIVARLKSW